MSASTGAVIASTFAWASGVIVRAAQHALEFLPAPRLLRGRRFGDPSAPLEDGEPIDDVDDLAVVVVEELLERRLLERHRCRLFEPVKVPWRGRRRSMQMAVGHFEEPFPKAKVCRRAHRRRPEAADRDVTAAAHFSFAFQVADAATMSP